MKGQENGVYVMRVASMLTGMHPQTLRKYERAGLLAPLRSRKLRLYSDKDIARLKTIKYLVDEVGLNIAGVRVALKLQAAALNIREQISETDTEKGEETKLVKLLDEILRTVSLPLV